MDERCVVRSYRNVFCFERRIFKVDRWRLPLPYGLPLRAAGYFLVCEAIVAMASRMPVIGALLGLLPAPIHWVALPAAAVYALTSWQIDGRPPHHTLAALIGWAIRPRCLAGLRHCPRVGQTLVPVGDVTLCPDMSEPRLRRGSLKGPADIVIRYPMAIHPEGLRTLARRAGGSPLQGQDLAKATRLRLSVDTEAPPLARGKTLHIPAGRQVALEPRR
jgi:hypothetical protein